MRKSILWQKQAALSFIKNEQQQQQATRKFDILNISLKVFLRSLVRSFVRSG